MHALRYFLEQFLLSTKIFSCYHWILILANFFNTRTYSFCSLYDWHRRLKGRRGGKGGREGEGGKKRRGI